MDTDHIYLVPNQSLMMDMHIRQLISNSTCCINTNEYRGWQRELWRDIHNGVGISKHQKEAVDIHIVAQILEGCVPTLSKENR